MPKIAIKKMVWDLSSLLRGDDDESMEKKLAEVEKAHLDFAKKWEPRSDYLEDPKVLKEALDDFDALNSKYTNGGDVGYYFWLRAAQDQNSAELKAKCNKINEISVRLENSVEFFTHRVSQVPPLIQAHILSSPHIAEYKHYLERLFATSKYLLAEEVEKILALKSKVSYGNWVKMTFDFLSREEKRVLDEDGSFKKKSLYEIYKLMSSKDKRVRDYAAKVVGDIYKKYVDIAEAELNSVLEDKKQNDDLRKITRPDLERHLSDDIESGVVDTMATAVASRFDISHRLHHLKARLLGVAKLEYYERNIEYGDLDKKYSYEEAAVLVGRVLNSLDSEFYGIFKHYVENGRIDVLPRKGKYSGAFNISGLKDQPSYILLNHMGKLYDVITFAHEMGHALNSEYMRRSQKALNFVTVLSTAEVASTFFEDFVLSEIEKEADDELKLAIMLRRLTDSVATIHRQVACYQFEQELHSSFRERGYLSKKDIGQIFVKHMSEYSGEFVNMAPGSENGWVYWDHIRDYFYVYSYASGLLISKALQGFVREDLSFVEKIKEFLSAGTTDSPKNIFSKLGLDITDGSFWLKGLSDLDAYLSKAEDLAKALGKI